jgi:molybdopterin-binding protein
MKISARNVLKGTTIGLRKGATTAHVSIEIGGGAVAVTG